MTRDECQAKLLEYLYDLLDTEERAEVERWLADDAACQAALHQAEQQKALLTAAAKTKFSNVRFEPPTSRPAPRPLARPVVRRRLPLRVRWAVAASIVLALLVGGGIYWNGVQPLRDALAAADQRYETSRQRLNETEMPLLQKRQVATQFISRLKEQNQEFTKKTEELTRATQDNYAYVSLTGPANIEAGAINNYEVAVRNLHNQPVDLKLSAKLLDAKQQPVCPEDLLSFQKEATGNYRLTVPPTVDLKGHSQVHLIVAARWDNGQMTELGLDRPVAVTKPVYMTHLATDKPMYLPGESVYFRSLTLERSSLKPADEDLRLHFAITSPSGDEVFHSDGSAQLIDARTNQPLLGPNKQPIRGVGAGVWTLDANARGGEYTLTVSEMTGKFPPEKRKFIVNRYEKPRLKKELEFTRKSFGAGDEVVAACKVSPAEGGQVLANRPVQATVMIDGKQYGIDGKPSDGPIPLKTDAAGAVIVRFKLPETIDRGDASLAVQFTDGGSLETLVRPIPIIVKKFYVRLFPEGGDLVAGVPNRVYFQARTTLDKPAELTGRLLEDGKEVATLETLHDDKEPGANQGLGAFTFTPLAGHNYALQIDKPVGIAPVVTWSQSTPPQEGPEIKTDGVVLTIPQGVASEKEPIRVQLRSVKQDRTLLVGAYCRGRLMASKTVTAKAGAETAVELNPAGGLGGVYRVTVFEQRGEKEFLPVAERLTYRAPAERLNLTLQTARAKYMPGEKAKLFFEASDEHGHAMPAIVMVAVVDKNLLTLADEKTHRVMPTHFFLTSEVRKPEDLEHADFLLGNHPKAAVALDMLLGTQGWRRFAEQNVEQFQEKNGDDADRYLVTIGQSFLQISNYETVANAANVRLAAEWTAKLNEFRNQDSQLRQELDKANAEYAKLIEAAGPAIGSVTHELRDADHERRTAADKLGEYQRAWRVVGLAMAGGLLLTIGLVSLIRAMALRGRQAQWRYGLAACSLVLLVCGLAWLGQAQPPSARPEPAAAVALATPEPLSEIALGDKFREITDLAKDVDGDARDADKTVYRLFEDDAKQLEQLARLGRGEMGIDGRAAGANWFGLGTTGLAAGAKGGGGDKLGEAGFGPRVANGARLEGLQEGQHQLGAMNDPAAAYAFQPPGRADQQLHNLGDRGDALAGLERLPQGRALQEAEGMGKRLRVAEGRGPAQLQADGKPKAGGGFGENGQQLGLQGEAKPRGGKPVGGLGVAAPAGTPAPPMVPPLQQNRGGGMPGMPAGEPMPGGGAQPFYRAQQRAGGIAGMGGGRVAGRAYRREAEQAPAPLPPPCVVREYAHHHSLGAADARADFTETLYWHPALVLDKGKGAVDFDLCDSLTTFQVLAYGHTLDGRIGAATLHFESRLPFSVEPKIPVEVTATDKIDLPVTIANDTDERRQVTLGINVKGLTLAGSANQQLTLAAKERVRRLFRLQPNIIDGYAELQLDGRAGPLAGDSINRRVNVVPDGFPVVAAKSDVLEKVAVHDVILPESWIPGTLKLRVQVYPSTLAELQQGLEGLLREPNGCFEQTSSSNYPNVLILNYLKETDKANPQVAAHARDLLERGYQKLVSFECQNQAKKGREGYEWFGGAAPPHEALTAYGLLEFRDMAAVYPVDQTMVERTRGYLMSCRDGRGGFNRNPRALDSFGRAPEDITNAYIVWSLTEAGDEDLSKELMALKLKAKASNDPYFLGLVANALLNRNQAEDAVEFLKKVGGKQQADGHLDAATTSITGSGGRDLQIETTALALLGWLKANRPSDFVQNIQTGIKWLGQQRGGHGSFGSTQSTILALKALIAFTKANKKTADAGELVLKAGDRELGRVKFAAGAQEALSIEAQETLQGKQSLPLHAGKNTVRVEITGNNVLPYTLSWSYRTLKPLSAEGCPVKLETKLDRTSAEEGDTVRLNLKVQNVSGKGQGMAVAILGLPAGLTLPEDFKQLKDYARLQDNDTKPGRISAWETQGRELILYWRDLAPDAVIELPIDLICRVPGEYRGPASRAYLYYNADTKHWVEPLAVTIKAKAE